MKNDPVKIIHQSNDVYHSWLTRINLFCLFYLFCWMLLPAISYYMRSGVFQVVFGAIVCCWILTALIRLSMKDFFFIFVCCSVFFPLALMYIIFHYGNANLMSMLEYVLLLGFCVNSIVYQKLNCRAIDKRIIIIGLGFLCLTALTTTFVLFQNSNASRILTSSSTADYVSASLRRSNIGSFDLIYSLVILFPLVVKIFFKNMHMKIKILFGGISLLFTICILKANFTTALMLLFVGCILGILCMFKPKMIIFSAPLWVTGLIFIKDLFICFVNFLYSISNSIYAREKLLHIMFVLQGNGDVNTLSSRFDLLHMSISSFLRSPIWGVGNYHHVGLGVPVGQHTQIVDDFARFGLLGGIPILLMITFCFSRNLYPPKRPCFNRELLPCFILFLLLGFLNPLYKDNIMIATFILAPALSRLFIQGETK